MYERYEHLTFSLDGAVLTLGLNNPPLNSGGKGLHRELSLVFREISHDRSVNIVILTGEGRAFSAGGDLKELLSERVSGTYPEWPELMLEAREIILSILDCRQPIIAKVNGPAIGLGATLALCCDLVFAADNARIADPHVALGLTAGDGAAILWPQLIGFHRAKQYLLTGEPLTGKKAAEIGLVNGSAPAEELDALVATWAGKIAALPPRAIASTKRAINLPLLREAVSSMDASLGLETTARLSEDHLEALTAIVEKRPGTFVGR